MGAKEETKKQQPKGEDNQGIAKLFSQGFRQIMAWAAEVVKVVCEWAPLIGEEGEAQEAQRQEQEERIFKQEVMASRILGLIETGLEDLMGTSNGIITWNRGNI